MTQPAASDMSAARKSSARQYRRTWYPTERSRSLIELRINSSSSTTWTTASSDILLHPPRQREAYHELSAEFGIGPSVDSAPVHEDDATADRKSKSHPTLLSSVKRIEETGGVSARAGGGGGGGLRH